MKNNNYEEEFIKRFIRKNKQDRLLWEIKNPKKRKEVYWKFSGVDIFKDECLKAIGYITAYEVEKYLIDLSHVEEVYFLGEDYIGKISLKEAMQKVNRGDICIIYCGNGIGYYQGEEMYGKRPRYFLEMCEFNK